MPVTVTFKAHKPKAHPQTHGVQSVEQLLKQSCRDVPAKATVIASAFNEDMFNANEIQPSNSSLVRSAIEAWGRHSHLVLRPDDFWFAILTQMNFYMAKNAESLRHLFVSHSGKKELVVESESWAMVLDDFERELEKAVKVDWLTEWVSPGFSTSTTEDNRTAIVLMMGMMKKYFKFTGGIICGIPSITILGKKADWQRLVDKITCLKDFGRELEEYASRLRPVLTRIVGTFDRPHDAEIKSFWDQMVQAKIRHSNVCGQPPIQYMVSGWILALFYWNETGWRSYKLTGGGTTKPGEELAYDGIRYGETALEDLPLGYARAKFKMLNASCKIKKGYVLAGNIAKRVTAGSPKRSECHIQPHRSPSALQSSQTAQTTDKVDRGAMGTQSNKDGIGCLSGLLRRLNCFRGTEEPPAEMCQRTIAEENLTEKKAASNSEKQYASHEQSTIQPLSGWFLYGPQKENDPFVDEEEDYGTTVDAIRSCENVEHVGDRY